MYGVIHHRAARMLLVAAFLILLSPMIGCATERNQGLRAVFDADYYYNQNPDLGATIGYDPEQLFSHFVSSGIREGRSGNAEFNLKAYAFYNPDLLAAYKTNLSGYCEHYLTLGKAERRISQPQEDGQAWIGTYCTSFDPALPRATNINLAVQRIHGVILQPGEAFSFSHAVLSRTAQNGYILAPAIGGYEYGGGICQVSSTLYAAMCHALLPATERHPHSARISYMPAGLDATISEGHKDLKFVNIYHEPLTILADATDGVLTVSLCLGTAGGEAAEADLAAEAQAGSMAETQAGTAGKVQTRPGVQAQMEPTAEAQADSAAGAQADSAAGAQADPAAEAQADPAAEAQADSVAGAQADSAAETLTDSAA